MEDFDWLYEKTQMLSTSKFKAKIEHTLANQTKYKTTIERFHEQKDRHIS